MSDYNTTLDSPTFQPIGPKSREFTHDGVTYTVESWTSRDHRLYLPTGEYAGKFPSFEAMRRFLDTVEYH